MSYVRSVPTSGFIRVKCRPRLPVGSETEAQEVKGLKGLKWFSLREMLNENKKKSTALEMYVRSGKSYLCSQCIAIPTLSLHLI